MSEIPCEVCDEEGDVPTTFLCEACLAMARGFWSQHGDHMPDAEQAVIRAMLAAVEMSDEDALSRPMTHDMICRMAAAAVAALKAQ